MIAKLKEKEIAIRLRRKGLSYKEILRKVPVAKSSLSLWLQSVGLSKKQKQRLTKKKIASALRGALSRKNKRLDTVKMIGNAAKDEIGRINKRELWLIGTTLYWAEGARQKEHNVSQVVKFSNSDPRAVRFFLKWLGVICKIPRKDINFRIALHENSVNRLTKVKIYWSKATGFSLDCFQKIDWKKNKIKTKRKNVGQDYFGLLNVYVKKSTNFNRKISGWIEGISNYCRVV